MLGVLGGRLRPPWSMPEPTWLSGWNAVAKPIGVESKSEPRRATVTEQTLLQHGPSEPPLA
jgi:hypothetical protein